MLNRFFGVDQLDQSLAVSAFITGLERERATITARLDNTVTVEQERAIKEYAVKVGKGLLLVNDKFEVRRQIIELLDVRAILSIEDGKKIACVNCMLDIPFLD